MATATPKPAYPKTPTSMRKRKRVFNNPPLDEANHSDTEDLDHVYNIFVTACEQLDDFRRADRIAHEQQQHLLEQLRQADYRAHETRQKQLDDLSRFVMKAARNQKEKTQYQMKRQFMMEMDDDSPYRARNEGSDVSTTTAQLMAATPRTEQSSHTMARELTFDLSAQAFDRENDENYDEDEVAVNKAPAMDLDHMTLTTGDRKLSLRSPISRQRSLTEWVTGISPSITKAGNRMAKRSGPPPVSLSKILNRSKYTASSKENPPSPSYPSEVGDSDAEGDKEYDTNIINSEDARAVEENQPISVRRRRRQSVVKSYYIPPIDSLQPANGDDEDDFSYYERTQESIQETSQDSSLAQIPDKGKETIAATKLKSHLKKTQSSCHQQVNLNSNGPVKHGASFASKPSDRHTSIDLTPVIIKNVNFVFASHQTPKLASIPSPSHTQMFNRIEIREAIGGSDRRTNVTVRATDQTRHLSVINFPTAYVCVRKDFNPYFMNSPGENGVLFEIRDELVIDGGVMTYFKADDDGKWIYFGDYRCQESVDLGLKEWRMLPMAFRQAWARHLLDTKWGRELLIERGFSKEENKKTMQDVLAFFDAPDSKDHLRLIRRVLRFETYDRDLYDHMCKVANNMSK